MTVNELIECLENMNGNKEVLYGVNKEKVDWLHICQKGVVLISDKDQDKVWD